MAMVQPYQSNQANQSNDAVAQQAAQRTRETNAQPQQAAPNQTVQPLPEPQRVNPPNLGQKVDFFA